MPKGESVKVTRTHAGWFAGMAAIASALTMGAVAAAAGGPPVPLPVGSDGMPVGMLDEAAQLAPGTSQLLAVKPAGSSNWYRPADVGVVALGSGVASRGEAVSSDPPAAPAGVAPRAVNQHGASPRPVTFRPLRQLTSSYGCNVNPVYPTYSYGGTIQGYEDFTSCYPDTRSIEADVCMKDSQTYGLHACSYQASTVYPWEAWSGAYACQNVVRQWQTIATNTFHSYEGDTAIFGNSSYWSSGIRC